MENTEVKEIRQKRSIFVSRKLPETSGHDVPVQIPSTATQQMICSSAHTQKGTLNGRSLCLLHCVVEYRNSEEFSMKISAFQPQGCNRYFMIFIFKVSYFLL
jgi:hypothetical protein